MTLMQSRCKVCGIPGAIGLLDREYGPWCRLHIPWRPVAPGWGPRRCKRCPKLGTVVLDNLGRRHGPFCRQHLPPGWAFDAAADQLVVDAYAEFESKGWRSA